MKLCFASDLHGREPLYDELTSLVAAQRPELIILGGDLFVDGDIDDPISTQVAYVDSVFIPRIDAWKRDAGLDVACILGNHDWACTAERLHDHTRAGRLHFLNDDRVHLIRGVPFTGFSLTPPTPYWVKDFERLDRRGDATPETGGMVWNIERRSPEQVDAAPHFNRRLPLDEELARFPDNSDAIFVCHAPPYDTALDRLPHIPYPVGSRAVRDFIERRQPPLCLHGHIHESPQVTGRCVHLLGKSLCVNPGQGHDRLWAVCLDTADPLGTIRHFGLGQSVAELRA